MANEQNLIPTTALTESEQRAMASRAGKASGVARRKKRTLREISEMIGKMELKNERLLALMHEAGFQDPITNDAAAQFGLLIRAQKGDPAANKLVAELRGEYSTKVQVEPVQPKPLIDLTQPEQKK